MFSSGMTLKHGVVDRIAERTSTDLTKPREMVSFSMVLVARFLPCCQHRPGTR